MIRKIISGGQAGVDRAALDFFMQLDIPCGGWCPRGRMAENGIIPKKYPLKETTEKSSIYRTKRNVEESDGTLIIFNGLMDKGSKQTMLHTQKLGLPLYQIDLSAGFLPDHFIKWIKANEIEVLNIAGPRESKSPGIYKQTLTFLEKLKNLF